MKNKPAHIPTVKGFRVGKKFYFDCPFCQRFHNHGVASEGTGRGKLEHNHRVAHCINEDSPFKLTGYFLKEYTKAELQKMKGWIDEVLTEKYSKV